MSRSTSTPGSWRSRWTKHARGAQALEEEAVRCESQVAVKENDIYHNRENQERLREEIARSDEGGRSLEADIAAQQEQAAQKEEDIRRAESEQMTLSEEMERLARSSDDVTGQMEALSRTASDLALKLSDIRVKAVTSESSLTEITMRLSQLTAGVALRHQQREEAARRRRECEEQLRACQGRAEELQNAVKGYEMRAGFPPQPPGCRPAGGGNPAAGRGGKAPSGPPAGGSGKEYGGLCRQRQGCYEASGTGGPARYLGARVPLGGYRSRLRPGGGDRPGARRRRIWCASREEDAKRGIAYLKESKAGRATFLPLTSVKGSLLSERGLSAEPGFVGLAAELVKCEEQYEGVVRSLLGRTAVAEDLDYAVTMARKYGYRFRVVTLDGQVVNAGGSLTGGSHVKNAGLLSRRTQIDTLQQEAQALRDKAEAAAEKLRTAQQEAAAVEAELSGAKGELATAQEDGIRFEAELRRLREQEEAAEKAVAEYAGEIETLSARAEECRALKAQAEEEAAGVQKEKEEAEAELSRLTDGGRSCPAAGRSCPPGWRRANWRSSPCARRSRPTGQRCRSSRPGRRMPPDGSGNGRHKLRL